MVGPIPSTPWFLLARIFIDVLNAMTMGILLLNDLSKTDSPIKKENDDVVDEESYTYLETSTKDSYAITSKEDEDIIYVDHEQTMVI